MDLNRTAPYVLLSPFFTRPLKQQSDNTVEKNQIYHTSPQPSTLTCGITVRQARVQFLSERSFNTFTVLLLVQVLSMTFRGKKMLPLPLPFHGHLHKHNRQHSKCTGELKVNTGLSASSYIVFNKTAEVNVKVAFGFGIRI